MTLEQRAHGDAGRPPPPEQPRREPAPSLSAAHALDPADVAGLLATAPDAGLGAGEAAARLARDGPNRVAPPASTPYGRIALRQLADPLVALLIGAALVSYAVGEALEAAVIGAIVLLNAVLGFTEEVAAERAVIALRESFPEDATVVRDGREQVVAAADVVRGDVLVVREGARVPADARVVESASLEVDESALTGESLPAEKRVEAVEAGAALGDRQSMIYTGSAVTRGRARAIVTATGARSELGAIARLTAGAAPPPTPLQARLGRLAVGMVGLGLVVTGVLGAAMLAYGSTTHEAFLTAVSVAVAAVPEGLAATVTVALALGARTMAGRGAIVRRLAAIETVGQTTLVCTDKTGTLTENRLRVVTLVPAPGVTEGGLLEAAAAASTAELVVADGAASAIGDPVDSAVVLAADAAAVDVARGRAGRVARELPFTSERRRLTVLLRGQTGLTAFTKGAAETVLERCTGDDAAALRARVDGLAADGLRVLAVARRRFASPPRDDRELERQLEPLGLVGLRDPLRPRAAAALAEARRAGISVRMLTGDHPVTARAIGSAIGLTDDEIYARVTPAEKLRIVEDAQAAGEVVLVTGDGVNDAPALRAADVGAAMGQGGTEPAREAADIVLADDEFATIVTAIAEGRRVAANVRKVIAFLLSANLGEVVLFALAIGLGLGVPMTVVQILIVNVVTDGLPALALARDASDPLAMRRPPAPRAELLPRGLGYALAVAGLLVGAVGLAAYLAGGGADGGAAQTMTFMTIALAELLLVFTLRSAETPAWRVPATRALVLAVLSSAALLVACLTVAPLRTAAGTVSPSEAQLVLVLGLACIPAVAVELAKAVRRRRRTAAGGAGAARSVDTRKRDPSAPGCERRAGA